MKKTYVSAMVLAALLSTQCYAGGVKAAKVTYDNLGAQAVAGVVQGNDASYTLSDGTVTKEDNTNSSVYGVLATDGATITADQENIAITANNTGNGDAVGVSGDLLQSNGNYTDAGHVKLGETETTKNIDINANASQGYAVGLQVLRSVDTAPTAQDGPTPGTIKVEGENLTINAYSENGLAAGIWVQNNTTTMESADNRSSVEINAQNTTIISNTGKKEADPSSGEYNNLGIVNYSQGIVKINNNLTIQAGTAISTRGNAETIINENGKGTVKIDGDINFNYDQPTSGTAVDAVVDINLSNSDSYLNGNIFVNGNPYPPSEGDKDKVNSMSLGLSNGAQWTTDGTSFVNNLKLDDGIINIVGDEKQAVTITSLEGAGTVNMRTEKTEDGFSAGILNIDSAAAEKTGRLGVNFTGINADDIKNVQDDMNALAANVKINQEANITSTAHVGEGLLSGAISAQMSNGTNGNTVIVDKVQQAQSTSTMENMKNIAAVSIAAWRQQGIWARMNRGEFEYSGAFKNQYNYFQIGYDMARGDWHYGAAVSYNDGETSYADGYGENSSTSLSLYGTRLLNDGQYLDLVLKVGRLSNEFDNYAEAGDTHGDYDAWGTEISGEYGKKLALTDGWFVTPQAQLSLMRIGSEDYTTSNGIHVDQDTLYSAVGRVGFEAGKDTGWGSFYAKASVLHEFAGDADTWLERNGSSNSYSQDIGDTWYEAGFGFNWKMSGSSYLYADVIRTFGGDIETPWQWNAGVRWGF